MISKMNLEIEPGFIGIGPNHIVSGMNSYAYIYRYCGPDGTDYTETVLERKSKCDIFIDQVGNKGGWGYGMNSVEALSMGICTLTEMNDEYNSFIPDHPFIHVTKDTICQTIQSLITNPNKLLKYKNKSKEWVDKTHNIKKVADELYNHYQQLDLPC